MSQVRNSRTTRISGSIVLAGAAVLTLLPLYSVFVTALQTRGSSPSGLGFPSNPQWHNFVDAWNAANMGALLLSSTLIVVGVVPVSLLLATTAGYALALLPFRGHRAVYAAFVAGLTLPFEALVAPLYLQVQSLQLLNSRWAIIVPLVGLFMPFGVFWMRAHFLSLPAQLRDAAALDGATSWQAFRHVFAPLSGPAWSSLGVLLFLWTWNQFLLAVALVDDPTQRTMAGALGAFQGQYGTDIVLLSAGSLTIMVPTIVVFVLFQRRFAVALLQGVDR
jgi:raffinose/stachyose/melibiose transport system permease protein